MLYVNICLAAYLSASLLRAFQLPILSGSNIYPLFHKIHIYDARNSIAPGLGLYINRVNYHVNYDWPAGGLIAQYEF